MKPDGAAYGGQSFSRGALYALLQNRLYRGEISYKGEVYPGEHDTIVHEALWDAVQVTLAANRIERATGARTKAPSLLSGMVFDESGERLTRPMQSKRERAIATMCPLPLSQGEERSGRKAGGSPRAISSAW